MKVTILPRQQIETQYHIWGKTYGTATDPKKTQRAAITSYPNPHHGPGDVDWQSPHTPKANRNPMPQRVIHPTNRTPASSSLANFEVQQASRIKRSIFATLVVIQRATTDTTFSKGTWHQIRPQHQTRGKAEGTATDPKKTQHFATTSYPDPHHGPGDVEWQSTHKPGALWVLISRI